MIIDSHNHMGGPDRGDKAEQSASDIIARMDHVGVDKAVVFPFNEIDPGISFSKANDRTAREIKRYPDRLIGFARLDPNFKEKAINEANRAVKELGLKGIKLHPRAQDFSILDPYVLRIIETAAELEVPVVFDNGKPGSNREIAELAEKVPDAKIILAHTRGEGFIEAARDHKNIFLGTVKSTCENTENVIHSLDAKKIIAGSDSPYGDMEFEMVTKFDIKGLSRRKKALVQGKNMGKVLGIL